MPFATAITLQQLLNFNDRYAIKSTAKVDEQVARNQDRRRAFYAQYDELHTRLRREHRLLARRVEANLDWRAIPTRTPQ